MIEAHVVNARNKHLYERPFLTFLQRHHEHCAVGDRRSLLSGDGPELDPFDTPQATYLLGMLEDQVISSARLTPTTIANHMSEEFSDMCEHIRPCHPDWADLSRTCVLPEYRDTGANDTFGQMLCAVMEFCLDEGITHTGGVMRQFLLKNWLDLGWNVIPAGLPRLLSGEWHLVAYVDVNEISLRSGRLHAGIDRPLVVRNGAQIPFIKLSRSPTMETVS
ncbi:N-acyl-L-homoserine lactone synthetase [Hoeflea sp. IMCC20628]|uniref:acyl-homoserine-lactone synthase n=1 Tax=Hoeflea sp. IMCC20628 TaxID=1620421 RepID=UPI00063B02C8|nr:acyl-homoserine-lactone synthase [Hoeflea sp. IMCC20628]AKI00220.1 N-acyl-L-homoserine lactone synthetase [Hoeflea sp. IMCC20628]